MNRSIAVAIPLALVLLMFLVFIACTPGPANQSAANASNRAESAALLPGGPPRCDPNANATDRAAAMNLHFSDANNANTGDQEIDRQRGGGFNAQFDVVGNAVVMRIKGRIASKEQGGPKPKLQQLINRYEWYLKKGCADRISFESAAPAMTSAGFEWTICDGTQVTCPNGTCANSASECPTLMPRESPTPTNDANANANRPLTPNSNANGNSNTNSNSNRSSNTRSGP